MKLAVTAPAPAGCALIRDVRTWHGGTPVRAALPPGPDLAGARRVTSTRSAMGHKVIGTPHSMFCMENHEHTITNEVRSATV
jgi:hypothetical protein